MFRILVAEDIEDTLKELQALLSDLFPDSKIDTAQTVNEGLELIRKASEHHLPYDVAVLDFKLPQEMGDNPEVHDSLCLEIKRTMPHMLIAYITAYPNDDTVEEHLKTVSLDLSDPRVILASKLEADWATKLVAKMKAYLYGTRIEARMDELFGTARRSSSREKPRTMYSSIKVRRSITHELAALNRDIIAHWDDLDERLKKRIQSIFNVDTESDPIHISLL